jgi:anaerobic selenocysteine-containing dehydrogenase
MTDTTGVAVGDYVWGTNIAPNAKVTSITNSTTVVVDNANVGTVSGTLRFNQLPSETVDAQLGFKLKVRFKTAVTVTQTLTGFWIYTTSTTASRAYQHTLNPVTVTITAKDANTLAAVSGAMVQVEATSGGALPALASVTITRSGTTATVSHTAHGLPTNTDVVIRGADQQDYNGSKRITVVDANSYTFTVANSPATPATGTITIQPFPPNKNYHFLTNVRK